MHRDLGNGRVSFAEDSYRDLPGAWKDDLDENWLDYGVLAAKGFESFCVLVDVVQKANHLSGYLFLCPLQSLFLLENGGVRNLRDLTMDGRLPSDPPSILVEEDRGTHEQQNH